MRGAISFLQLIVLGLIFLLVSSFFINQIMGAGSIYEVGKAGRQILGNPGEITYETTALITPINVKTATHIYPLEDWKPFRPSEIACIISNEIYKDFVSLGKDGERSDCIRGVYKDFCFLDSKEFTIDIGKADELNWINKLINEKCTLCNISDKVVQELDEVCLNANLNMKKEIWNICIDRFSPKIGGTAAFSNCWCFKSNANPTTWKDYCNGYKCDTIFSTCNGWLCYGSWCHCGRESVEFCDNENGGISDSDIYSYAKNMIDWYVETSSDTYIVSDTYRSIKPTMGDSDDTLAKYPNKYIYGIFWFPQDLIYRIYFERVPLMKYETSFDFLVNEINNINSNKLRYSILGLKTSKARRIIDRIVKLSSDNYKSISALANDISNKIRFKLNTKSDPCFLFELTPDYSNCTFLKTGCESIDCIEKEGNELISAGSKVNFYKHNLEIRTSLQNLEVGKIYRVTVNNWIGVEDNPNNENPTFKYSDKSIGIYKIKDEKINDCCQGKLILNFNSPVAKPNMINKFKASGIKYCDKDLIERGTIYFYDSDCSSYKPGDSHIYINKCDIHDPEDEQTLYCLAEEEHTAKPHGCEADFTTPNIDKTYYACMDINGDGDFNDDGEIASAKLTVQASLKLEWRCSDWKTINGKVDGYNYADFISENCGDDVPYAISCSSENYYPSQSSDTNNYGEDVVSMIKIDNDHCFVRSIDLIGENEQGRKVCVLCSNQKPTIVWGAWNIQTDKTYGNQYKFLEAESCPEGTYPVSCMVDVVPNIINGPKLPQEYEYNIDDFSITDLYLEDNRCKATIRDNYKEVSSYGFPPIIISHYFYPSSINIGTVCFNINYVETWGSMIDKNDNYQELFDSPKDCGNNFISIFTKVDNTQDKWLEDAIQSFYKDGIYAYDTVDCGPLCIINCDCSEQRRQVGIKCI